ncbi:11378_t:CDS:2 [Entrophospora sp. SA101]|nr:12159_t:CDS:2 [Entrophospora sp. SA101]CAJ0754385.1 11378_t:CDS:2 [Entrophospora sp. SA101]CAJ0838392.1 2007_t:CDS:2 [Entrophospora sp. SA101]CAJ0844129.1 5692_t:CDS:2 [Entrophospora sp. SA101]
MLTKNLITTVIFFLASFPIQNLAIPYNNEETAIVPLLSSVNAQVIPDQYIVVLKDKLDKNTVDYHHNCVHSAITDEQQNITKRGLSDEFVSGVRHVYYLDGFKGYSGRFSNEVLNIIRQSKEVAYVEKDQVVYANELQRNAPWGLARISHRSGLTFSSFNKYIYDESAGEGTTVYIIDTGINIYHVDFEGRAVWGVTVPDNDQDIDGNGTHVAGTVAGKRYGVSKKAKVVAIKVLRSNGSGTMSDVIKGVEYAVEFHLAEREKARKRGVPYKGAGANMSLGGGRSRTLDNVVDSAVDHGLIFAVAAGNDNGDACNASPAASEKAITVAASTIEDERAWFSNYGTCVDVFAPVNITSAWIGSRTATNTISGTSMASPHVAGLIAYFMGLEPDCQSEFYTQSLSPNKIKDDIIKLSTKNVLRKVPANTKNLLVFNNYS